MFAFDHYSDAFKPASITSQTSGTLEPSPSTSGGRIVAFDAISGSQVFDVREEQSKSRECAIVWDEGQQVRISVIPF